MNLSIGFICDHPCAHSYSLHLFTPAPNPSSKKTVKVLIAVVCSTDIYVVAVVGVVVGLLQPEDH
jgi:hypothetical protein